MGHSGLGWLAYTDTATGAAGDTVGSGTAVAAAKAAAASAADTLM